MDFDKTSEFRQTQYGAICWLYRRKTEKVGADINIGQNVMSAVSAGSSYGGKHGSRAIMIVEDRKEYLDIKDWLRRAMKKFSYTYVLQMDRKTGEKIAEKDLIKGLGIMSGASYSAKVERKPVRNQKTTMSQGDIMRYIHAYDSRHVYQVIRQMANSGSGERGSFNQKAYAAAKARSRHLLESLAYRKDSARMMSSRLYIAQEFLRQSMGQELVDAIFMIGSSCRSFRYPGFNSGSKYDDAKMKKALQILLSEKRKRDANCRGCEVTRNKLVTSHEDPGWKDPHPECFKCKVMPEVISDLKLLHPTKRRQNKREKAVLRRGDLSAKV